MVLMILVLLNLEGGMKLVPVQKYDSEAACVAHLKEERARFQAWAEKNPLPANVMPALACATMRDEDSV